MNVARNGLPLPKAYVNVFFLLGIYRLYLKDALYYNEMISWEFAVTIVFSVEQSSKNYLRVFHAL